MVGRSHGRTSALRKLQKLQQDLVSQQQMLQQHGSATASIDAILSSNGASIIRTAAEQQEQQLYNSTATASNHSSINEQKQGINVSNDDNAIITEPQEKRYSNNDNSNNYSTIPQQSKARTIVNAVTSQTLAAVASRTEGGRKQLKGMVRKYTNFLRRNTNTTLNDNKETKQ